MDSKEETKRAENSGEVYYPSFLFKEIVMMMVVFVLTAVVLAGFFPAGLEDPADPTDNLYSPKPEWYFMFLYQLLKYFPGKLEAVAAFLTAAGGFGIMVLLPFIDRNPEKRPRERPVAMIALLLIGSALVLLTVLAALS
jgi:quinol-cytochrome oxidoreductase complex cytochrome b subunit